MATHTPGPWIRDGLAIEAGGQTICIMGEIDGFERGYRPCLNAQADAPLIAAAPELLAACERLLPQVGWSGKGPEDAAQFYCEHCGETHENCDLVPHTSDCPVSRARAAIAAARGES